MASEKTGATKTSEPKSSPGEDEDDPWIPLVPEEKGSDQPHTPASTRKHRASGSSTPQSERLQDIQRRLESRVNLKENLVNHPMDLFWKRYLLNLARELWELEFHIRLGLSMIVTGIFLKIFLLSTWYIWYPRIAFLSVVFIISLVYLDPFDIGIQMNRISKIIFSPEKAADLIEQLDMMQLRRLSFLLLMIPTALEMRTLSFLSQIKAESGWALYNILLASVILSLMLYLLKVKNFKPRECIYQGLLVLYGSALLVTIVKTDLRRMPVLAAPFLTATGTLLITYKDDDMEWMSRVLRHALRLTLRDVLSSVSDKVSEDEMLQLALLRWIADYWAQTPDAPPPPAPPQRPFDFSSSTQNTQSTPPPPASPSQTNTTQSAASERPTNTNFASAQTTPPNTTPTSPRPRQSSFRLPRHEVQWGELLPMLNVATDHMTSEVHMLQSSANTSSEENAGTSNGEDSFPTRDQDDSNEALDNLRAMLMSLDVDEGARPAVMAYRRAVERFPPAKKTAVVMSIMRRCPGLLTLLWHCVFGSRSLFSSTVLILPFIVLEYYRIQEWMSACEQMTSFYGTRVDRDESWGIPPALADAEVMTILLCGDTHSCVRPPTLFLVWQNIVNSVSALEMGLTAARCAQTTSVAVDFAGNIMSLMQFGYEVQQHGWFHGIAVMTKEFVTMHSTEDDSADQRRSRGTKYTSAAMGAVQNAQVVARNVQSLSEDENLDHVLQPIVWTLTALSGYGWLWGNDEPSSEGGPADDETPANSKADQPSTTDSTTQSDTEGVSGDDADAKKQSKATGTNHAANELSEVMDMVATAYEQGLIEEAEKNEFCEKLSNLSENELFDPSVVAGMKRTLQIIIDNGGPPETDEWHLTEATKRVDPASVMGLVMTAYEKGLIDESENKAFIENLAGLSEEERSDEAVVGGMLRTLEAILDTEAKHDNETVSREKESGVARGQEVNEDVTEEENQSTGASDIEASQGIGSSKDCGHQDEMAPTRIIPAAPTLESSERDPSLNLAAPVGAIGSQDEAPGEGNLSSTPTSSDPAVARTSSIQDGDPLVEAPRDETERESSQDGNDAWAKFGIAALGVVVGGVLLSMQGGNENASSEGQQENERRNKSTVKIEELSDDGEDEWVSIPKSD